MTFVALNLYIRHRELPLRLPNAARAHKESLLSRNISYECSYIHRKGEREGKQCGNPALAGTTVCRKHGGNAAHVREAAGRRLTEGAPRAADVLNEMMEQSKDPDPCPLCKRGMPRDDNIIIKAAMAVLDRTGFGPSSKLHVEANVNHSFLEYLTDAQLTQIDDWIDEAKKRAALELGELTDEELE